MERERRSSSEETSGTWKFRWECEMRTSPIAVLGTTDLGNNWGERAQDRTSGQRGTSIGKQIRFFTSGETRVSGDPLEAQSGIVGEGGGEGPNISRGTQAGDKRGLKKG